MSILSSQPSILVDCGGDCGCSSFSSLHTDLIQTQILTRLDGQSLASASCASSEFQTLSSDPVLWKNISAATWPSINEPQLQNLITSFPSGHRSFFSDSFPAVASYNDPRFNLNRPRLPSEVISAVDIYYKNDVIFSGVQKTSSETEWFQSTPFRVDLLDPKLSIPTTILHPIVGTESILAKLEENLRLSWIIIDPTRKRAANLSSLIPISVQKHWFSGDIQVKFGSIFTGESIDSEIVQCEIMVTCAGEEGGELQLKEVSMHVEDMDGRILNGKDSLVILQNALESKRTKKSEKERRKERHVEYNEMKRTRREKREKKEKMFDFLFMFFGFSVTLAFWSFFS